MGPKVDNNISKTEKLLLDQITSDNDPINIEIVLNGHTNYQDSENKGRQISGSRQYVFWWLLRDSLRKRNIIQENLSKKYALMIFVFGVLGSIVVSTVTIVTFRLLQMLEGGEVDFGRIGESLVSSIYLSLLIMAPMIFSSFGLLKYRGKMLGRHWIVTEKYKRYVGQMDAFREFVRLTHKDKLRFESKELKKESIALTRPYAIACGYIKK
jgi:hypothetical protein